MTNIVPDNLGITLALEQVAKAENLIEYSIDFRDSVKGDGYLGIITRITIRGKTNIGEFKELNLITKTAPKSEEIRKQVSIDLIFRREIYSYLTIFPTFFMFQNENGVNTPFLSIPKCYVASKANELLILEDLNDMNYGLWGRKQPMNDKHVSLVFSEYARFHALSFAFRDKKPNGYNKIASDIYGFYKLPIPTLLLPTYKKKCEEAQKSLVAQGDGEALRVFKRFCDDMENYLLNIFKNPDEYTVILHGDCWSNNMMFKYEDALEPAKPTKMCIIDWQLIKIGSPVLDLSFFFYSTSSNEVMANLKYYLQVYYNSFSSNLKQFGCKPEEIYPYLVFLEHWRKYSKYGLVQAALILDLTLSDNHEVTNFADATKCGKHPSGAFLYKTSNLEEYNRRIRDVILHFVENKYM